MRDETTFKPEHEILTQPESSDSIDYGFTLRMLVTLEVDNVNPDVKTDSGLVLCIRHSGAIWSELRSPRRDLYIANSQVIVEIPGAQKRAGSGCGIKKVAENRCEPNRGVVALELFKNFPKAFELRGIRR
jgi:hypothetical protein